MASKMARPEKYSMRVNLECLCQINIGLVVDVFWEIVTHFIPANQLVIRISSFMPRKLKEPFLFRLDNLCQLGRDPDKSDCDFWVLYAIIRYMCPLSPPPAGWGKPSTHNDTSIGDDVDCICEARKSLIRYINVYYKPHFTDSDFQGYMKTYEIVLGRLDIKLGTNFSQRLHTLINESIESENRYTNYWWIRLLETQENNEETTDKLVKCLDVRSNDLDDLIDQMGDVSYFVNRVEPKLDDCSQHLHRLEVQIEEMKEKRSFFLHVHQSRPYVALLERLQYFQTIGFVPTDINLQEINMLQTVLTQTLQQTKSRHTIAIQVLEQISRLQHNLEKVHEMRWAATEIVIKRQIQEISNVVKILEKNIGNVAHFVVELEKCLQATTIRQTILEQNLQQRVRTQPSIHAPKGEKKHNIEERVQTTGSEQTTYEQSLPSRSQHEAVAKRTYDSLLLLYAELKDTLRRDQCRAIVKDIAAERHLPAEEKASFQTSTKRRDLVDWVLKYVLNQKDEMIFNIFCESLCKQSPSLGQTLQETSVHNHELVKTERQPATLQLDDLTFLEKIVNKKLVVDIVIDKLLSQFLITVEEHSSVRSSSYEYELNKPFEVLIQYDKEIMEQFKLITQSFRNASVSQTADWLVPLHAQAKETLSCGKGLAIATDIFQQIPGIISPSELDELYDLKDSSRDVIDRLLKHIYKHPRPEVFDVICYSLKDHDEDLYEHFLRMFFFKGCDKEKTKPVVNKNSGSGTDYFSELQWNSQTLDVVIDHLLSSFCITVDEHSDIRDAGITKLVELLGRSPQMITAANALLRHLDKIADTTNIGNKEITISFDFGDPKVNSQAKNHMDSLCGKTLTLAGIGEFYLKDVKEGSVMITISPLHEETFRRFRDMERDGTILGYLRDHVKEFLPDDVNVVLSESLIGMMEKTTCLPVQSASIINSTIELSTLWVYKMKNEPFIQPSILHPDHSKRIGSIRMFLNEPLSRETESNSPGRGIVFAGQLGSNGESLAIKRMLLRSFNKSMETYESVKERLQHRNIVKIFCVEKDETYGYVAMERMDENLVKYVGRSGQHGNADMDTEEEIYYMKHIVTGLTFIHKEGFLHNMFSTKAILLKKNNLDTHPKQVSIACFSDAVLCEHVPVSCKKGDNDVLELIKVLLFALNKEEAVVNGVIQPDNRIIQSGHFDIYVLLQDMLDSRRSDELKLQDFALHPALSNPGVQLHFLKEADRLRRELKVDFNVTNRTSVNITNRWLDEPPLTHIVHQYLINEGLHRTYTPHCLNSLVRCIRNCHEHLPDIIPQVQVEFGPKECYIHYWLVKFPGLVSSVYKAMIPHRNHTDLIRFFTIES